MSRRKITVSTSGVVPKIIQYGKEFAGLGLAISLHAVNNDLRYSSQELLLTFTRSYLVPANQQWPIEGKYNLEAELI